MKIVCVCIRPMKNIIKTLVFGTFSFLTINTTFAQDFQELIVWEDNAKSSGIREAALAFEKEHNCNVVLEESDAVLHFKRYRELPPNYDRKPDVYVLVSDRLYDAVTGEHLEPLSFMKNDADLYIDSAKKAFFFKGEYYAAPRNMDTLVTYYNKDLLKGPLRDFHQYSMLNAQMQKQGKWGLISKFDQLYITYGIISGYGGYLFKQNSDGTYDVDDVGLNNLGSVAALKALTEFSSKSSPRDLFTAKGWDVMDRLFMQGQVAAVISGPWAYHKYKQYLPNLGIAPLPILSDDKPMRPFFGTKGYVIPKDSKHKDLASQFIEFINQEKWALDRYNKISEVPPLKALEESSELKDDELALAILSQSKYADAIPSVPNVNRIWAPMGEALYNILCNQGDPKAFLDQAVDLIKDTKNQHVDN